MQSTIKNRELINRLQEKSNSLFGGINLITRSPGRVNIIGEHTDYNMGFVLPAAIDKSVYVALQKRNDDRLHFYSNEFGDQYEGRLPDIEPVKGKWPTYLLGVIAQLQKNGYTVGGFNAVVDGDIPIGAGLSSSAAIECATIYALNEAFDLQIPKLKMVQMAQKAEHEYAGVLCGIMDQFASMFGKKDHVIQLDCRSLEYEYIPLKLEGVKIVLFNTNVEHSLASTEYNTRRRQCEEGVAIVREHHPEVLSLRDITLPMLERYVAPKDEVIYRRCKYVVEEIERLLRGCEDLKRGDLKGLGAKMFRTHEGLSKEYEVSCKELDYLVDYVKDNDAVLGSRMMGGGFGGCTINLVREEAIDRLMEAISRDYKKNMNLELSTYIASSEDGSSVVQ
ncbi:MAG: galactokinase [Flavisolibacter sp.]|nr:galactokinase [Flavisolibacter sp.]